MSEFRSHVVVPGSEKRALSQVGSPVPGHELVDVTLVLRRSATGAASASDVDTVVRVMTNAGLEVLQVDASTRRVRVRGEITVVQEVFQTSLHEAMVDGERVRARSGPLYVPSELDGVIIAVLGLDNRPQARTRHRIAPRAAVKSSFTPVELAKLYEMPEADGSGQHIAIIELGGGFGDADLKQYFASLGIPQPAVQAISVDGARNVAGKDPQGADGEVLLDIEVAGGVASASAIDVYFAPNTDAGFLDAVAQAASAKPVPCAISISWGQSEDEWTKQALRAMDDAFADAEKLGIVVLAAAGDNGSMDGETSGQHCDFPASSPHVIGCGGTALHAENGKVSRETVWNNPGHGATGGGVSDVFEVPVWQKDAGVPSRAGGGMGRGVPDVAGNADPATGYEVLVDGEQMVIGGTSAVAPLWAGLVARIAQLSGGNIGPIAPKLYEASGLRDITSGSNGAYSAQTGWDACTGLGVPASGIEKVLSANSVVTPR